MASFNKYPDVFKPIKVGPLTVKNRLQFSPMVSCLSASNGEVTNEFVKFIEMQARTGAGIISIGATPIDLATGADFRGELNICEDGMLPGLYRISEAAHRYGAKITIEMCHAGRGADPELLQTPYALAPSPIPIPGKKRWVKEMDQNDIDHVIQQYVDCALRLKRAGFDMCMIHGAHGNLIGQFMSPSTNFRTDWYGGTFENRMRFPLQIMEAMREAVGSSMALELRISGDEIIPNGMHIDEVCKFLPMTQKYIDLVNVSQGLVVDPRYHYYTLPPYYNGLCHNVKWAEQVKKVMDIPVSTVGSIKTLKDAQEIIAAGKVDIIAMARQLMADPDTIKKSKAGDEEDIRPCLRCLQVCNLNVDFGRPIRCAVNPTIGREAEFSVIPKADVKKKVVVIGGGVAGMMAAQMLIKRGHDVVLFEAEKQLGGHLNDINKLPFKSDLKDYTDWDIRTTLKCGADIRLGVKATPALVKREKPDAILIATGSRLFAPKIPGIDGDNVKTVLDVDSGREETGQKVIVCGGGMSGLECALGLAMKGKEVTVLDMIPVDQFATGIKNITRNMLFMLLDKHNVKRIGDQRVMKITKKGLETMDHNWKTYSYEADTIVTAFGLTPNNDDMDAFFDIVPETYAIGDCWDGEKSIGNANMTAFNYAYEI